MAEETEKAPPESKRSSVLLIALGAFLIGGLIVFGYTMWSGSSDDKSDNKSDEQTAENSDVDTKNKMMDSDYQIVKLEKFSVNLRDPAGNKRLQMEISVEAKNGVAQTMHQRKDQMRNEIIMVTSEYTVENLDGLDGKMGLKDQIELRINNILKPQKVERVYFTDFVY